MECASVRRNINNGRWQVGREMPWEGDVRHCACSRATSLLLCTLRVFKTGPGEPLMFLLKKRNSSPADPAQPIQPSRCRTRGRCWAGGGAPAQPAVSSVRTLQVPSPQRKEPINSQGPTGPADLLLSRSPWEPDEPRKHWQDHCRHHAEGQFQKHSCTTVMPPWRSVHAGNSTTTGGRSATLLVTHSVNDV